MSGSGRAPPTTRNLGGELPGELREPRRTGRRGDRPDRRPRARCRCAFTNRPSARHSANGFVHNEAIAYELAARFYAARGFEQIAHLYLRNARDCYLRWGADGKVRQLEQNFPQLRRQPALTRSDVTIGTRGGRLDLATVVKASQVVSSEIELKKLIDILMVTALEHAGADRGLLILPRGDELWIEAEAITVRDRIEWMYGRRTSHTFKCLTPSCATYGTHDSVLLGDSADQGPFSADPHIRENRYRSLLCIPLINQTKLIGILYLENRRTSHVFTPARVTVLKLLASQAAISLENARLYAEAEESRRGAPHQRSVPRRGAAHRHRGPGAGTCVAAFAGISRVLANLRPRSNRANLLHQIYGDRSFGRPPCGRTSAGTGIR